ncbi:MAG: TIGR02594 family protein [Filomicrobium sp.]
MTRQPPWLTEAWREYGQSEIRGPRHNPNITAFFKELQHEEHARDEVPWCAAFVGACLERAGYKSTRSLMARSYAKLGEPDENERVGCLAVLSRGSNPALGHVGFLIGATEERIWLLGGNQGDKVSVAPFDRRRLVTFRWPTEKLIGADAGNSNRQTGDAVFKTALDHVLEMEGGFTDDPHDPGGPTNKGITLKVFAAWRRVDLTSATRHDLLAELRNIATSEVQEIYRQRYWRLARCEEFPPALALFHFDASVNHGVTGAARLLQEAVGAAIDGQIGPETKGKAHAMLLEKVLERYADVRRRKYRSLPHFWRFGRGWLRRVNRTLERAKKLARQPEEPAQPTRAKQQGSKSMTTQNMTTQKMNDEPKWWGESLTIWGALMTAAVTVLPILGRIFGLDLSADIVRELGDQIVAVGQAVVALVGTILTIYGRARAVQPIGRRDVVLKL